MSVPTVDSPSKADTGPATIGVARELSTMARDPLLWVACALLLLWASWLAVRPVGVFWSLDEGGKYLYLENILQTGDARAPLRYPGRTMDTELNFVPLYFWAQQEDQIYSWWPVGFSLLALPFYRLFGWPGLYVLPVAAGAASAILAGVLVRQMHAGSEWLAPAAALITGLATPVAFYSTLFWEHTPSMALLLAAVMCVLHALRTRRTGWLSWAAILAAAATFLRSDAAILTAGLLLALFVWHWRWSVRMGILYIVACAPWLSLNVFLMGSPLSRYWGQLTTGALEGAREAGLVLIPYVLLNAPRVLAFPLTTAWLVAGSLAVALAVVGPSLGRWRWLSAAGVFGVALVSAFVLVQPYGYRSVHGLVLVAPQVVLAAWLHHLRSKNTAAFFALAVLSMTVVFGCVYGWRGWLAAGGQQWGPRYLLAFYPLYVVAAIVGLAQHWPELDHRLRRAMAAALVVCVALGVGYELRGATAVWQTVQTYARAQAAIEALPAETIVTDCPWLINVMPQLYASKVVFTVRDEDGFDDWARQAYQAGVRSGYRVELDACRHIALDELARFRALRPDGITSERFELP